MRVASDLRQSTLEQPLEQPKEEVVDCLHALSTRGEGTSEGILATFPRLV